MPDVITNPFPLGIANKENSPELLAYFKQFGLENYLPAEEINKMVAALNYLYTATTGEALVYEEVFTYAEGNPQTFTLEDNFVAKMVFNGRGKLPRSSWSQEGSVVTILESETLYDQDVIQILN